MENLPVIIIRFALFADLMVLAGITAFSMYALSPQERISGVLPLKKPTVVLALTGLALSTLGMFALVASMAGSSIWTVDGEVFREIVGESAIGTAWIVRMAAMILAVLAAISIGRGQLAGHLALLASASIAIATLVWTGHAGATEGWVGTLHRLSDITHMLAASVWIGGIAAFGMLLFRPVTAQTADCLPVAHRALEQFSRVGALAVGAIIVTGVINSLAVMGLSQIMLLGQATYGKLLIVKMLLFGAMLALAAFNRWKLTPAFGEGIRDDSPAKAVATLQRSLLAEGAAALAILSIVAWLGTLEPPGRAM